MDRPRRTHAEARAQMRAGILRYGNEQLEQVGAAGLSVREIARSLGVASSAIYRHVANRDELLTLLIVDAYTDLADAVLSGDTDTDPAAHRLRSIARNMRAWATQNPARWALAYGSPVPGYAAPAEQTGEPGTRVMAVFLGLMAMGAGPELVGDDPVSEGLSAELTQGAAELGVVVDPRLAAAAVEAWTGLVGLVSAEVFDQLGPDLAQHGAELLDRWISSTSKRFALAG